MFSEALWLIPTWRPAAHSSFWSEWIPCFPSKTVCQCGVYTEVCWGYPSGIWRCVMAYLPPPPSFEATICLRSQFPSDVASHTHTHKKRRYQKCLYLFRELLLTVISCWQCLRCLARGGAVGDTSDFVSRIFIDSPSGRTLALGSNQPFKRNEYWEAKVADA